MRNGGIVQVNEGFGICGCIEGVLEDEVVVGVVCACCGFDIGSWNGIRARAR